MLFNVSEVPSAIPHKGTLEARKAADRHAAKIARVTRQLRAHPSDRPLSLRKRVPSHQVPKRNDLKYRDDKIDLTDLDEILEIDVDGRTCTAEPGVTFGALVKATMKHRLVPIIVPEFSTITLGGAVSGCSIESMSFRHGGFHDTCLEYEVVTATGDVLTCTPEGERALIFQMMHGSFGTLGILSKLVFKLVPAKPFVHLTYERFNTLAAYQDAIWRHYKAGDADYMDGFIHSPTSYVLNLGRFVDRAPYTNRYDWVKVYYQSTLTRREDYLELPQYLFRYDRGVTNPFPRTALGRLFFGKFLRSHETLWLGEKLHKLLTDRPDSVTLDVFVPFSRMPDFLSWYGREIDHFPLWVVPYRRVHDYEWLTKDFYASLQDELFIDLAIYGMRRKDGRNYYRLIEEELPKVNGVKTLISHNFYEEDEFWRTFNRANHEAVKRIVDPHNVFRDLYAKTCRATKGVEYRGDAGAARH